MLSGSTSQLVRWTDSVWIRVGEEVKEPDMFILENRSKHIITEDLNHVSVGPDPNIAYELSLNICEYWLRCQEYECLCIEGVSDNRDEFMIEYFKLKDA